MSVKVSIVILTHNVPQFVGEAIDSVLAQTFRDFELLVWDDGSIDPAVLPILQGYVQRDSRVRLVTAEHLGEQRARHRAIVQTTGEYLGWVDSDDRLAPTALARTVALLDAQPAAGMVYTDHLIMDQSGNVRGLGARCTIPYSPERLLIDFMTFHFRLMRRTVYDRVGGYMPGDTSRPAADYDLCLRLSEVTTIHHLAEPLYFYRDREGQVSRQRRMDQIDSAKGAIQRALERRGLADRVAIDVHLKATFRIKRKPVNPAP